MLSVAFRTLSWAVVEMKYGHSFLSYWQKSLLSSAHLNLMSCHVLGCGHAVGTDLPTYCIQMSRRNCMTMQGVHLLLAQIQFACGTSAQQPMHPMLKFSHVMLSPHLVHFSDIDVLQHCT